MNTRLLICPISDIRIIDTYFSGGNLGLMLSRQDAEMMSVGYTISLDFDDQTVNPQYNVDTVITAVDLSINVVTVDIAWGDSTQLQPGWIRNVVDCSGSGGPTDIGQSIFDPTEYYCNGQTGAIWQFAMPTLNDAIAGSGPPPPQYEIEGYNIATFGDNLLWFYSGGIWNSSTPANGTYFWVLSTCGWRIFSGGGWASPISGSPMSVGPTSVCFDGNADVAFYMSVSSIPDCNYENLELEITVELNSGILNVTITDSGSETITSSGTYTITGATSTSGIYIDMAGFDGCITAFSLRCGNCKSLRFSPVDLDLREDLQFPLSYQVADIREPQNRKSNFSKTITLPGTDHNNRILTQLFEVGIDSVYDVNRKKDVFVLQDGLEIIRGVIRIDKINRDDYNVVSYDVSIQGQLFDLFANLKNSEGQDLLLRDLDYSEYDHPWSRELVLYSWAGFIYQNGAPSLNYTPSAVYTVTDTFFAPGNRTTYSLGSTHNISVGDNVIFFADNPALFPNSQGNHTVIAIGATSLTVNVQFQSSAPNTGSLYAMYMHGTGYVYPTINTSKGPGEVGDWKTEDFTPAVYVKTYVDKIFEKIGYSYSSDFFESDFFKRLIIPGGRQDPRDPLGPSSAYGIADYMQTSGANQVFPFSYTAQGIESGMTFGGITGSAPTIPPGSADGAFNLGASSAAALGYPSAFSGVAAPFNVTVSGLFNGIAFVTFALDVGNVFNSGTSTNPRLRRMKVYPDVVRWPGQVYSNPQPWENPSDSTESIAFGATTTVAMVTVPLDMSNVQVFSGNNISLSAGMVVDLFDQFNLGFGYDNAQSNNFAVVDESGTDTYVSANLALRVVDAQFARREGSLGQIDLARSTPQDLKAKDLLIGLINMFNLYIEPDKENERNLVIEPFNSYYDPDDQLDWTDKVDISQPIRIEPTSPNLAKNYLFTYTEDGDHFNDDFKKNWNDIYGQQEVSRDTDFNSNTSTIKNPFSPTPLADIEQDDTVLPTIFKAATFDPPDSFKPRILYFQGVRYRAAGFLVDGVSTADFYQVDAYGYAGHMDQPLDATIDIDYGINPKYYYGENGFNVTDNTLYNTYYRNYVEELTDKDSKMVTFKMKLKSSDMANLSFRRIYYVDDIKYRLQRISDYDPLTRKPCDVQLLKVKQLPPFNIRSIASGNIGSNRPINARPGVLGPARTGSSTIGNVITSSNNVLGMNVGQTVVAGTANSIGANTVEVIINGEANAVGASARNVLIFGDRNIVPDGFDNVAIFGSGFTAISSNTVYFAMPVVGASGATFSAGATADALVQGSITISGATGVISMGSGGIVSADRTIQLGIGNNNAGIDSLILGSLNVNQGGYSIIAGSDNVGVTGCLTIGDSNVVLNQRNIVVGQGNTAVAVGNAIIGDNNDLSGNNTLIVGVNSTIGGGDNNVSFGNTNVINGDSNVVIGSGNNITGNNVFLFSNGENLVFDNAFVVSGMTAQFQGALASELAHIIGSSAQPTSRFNHGVIRFDRALGPTTTVTNAYTNDGDGVTGPFYTVSLISENATSVTFDIAWPNPENEMGATHSFVAQTSYINGGLTGQSWVSVLFKATSQVRCVVERAVWASGIIDVSFTAHRPT